MKQDDLKTLRLFSPLYPHIYRQDEYGDLGNMPEDLTAEEACDYEGEILALINRERLPAEGDRGLAVYLGDDALKRKVYSMKPTVEEWDGKLWGVLEVQTHGELSPSELEALKFEWCGQESDGWGEGAEQRPIRTSEGELYVSFWSSNSDFFIKTEEELKSAPEQRWGLRMGGM